VIVHPEVPWDVVQAADDSGSTEYIIKTVSNSPEGSIWAVGTEVHLVNRLAQQLAPGRTVVSLDQFGCLCSTMFRVSPNHLLWILEELVEGPRAQPDRRARRAEALEPRRARAHAVDLVELGLQTRRGGS
jgi:quinolinate synthase